jgi:hypothetical protein
MSRNRWIPRLILPLILITALSAAGAQDKSKGAGKDKDNKGQTKAVGKQEKQGKASASVAKSDNKSQSSKAAGIDKSKGSGRDASGSKGKEVREVGGTVGRPDFKAFAASGKKGHRVAGQAISAASKHGVSDDAFVITPAGRRVHVLNRSGALLLDLDDDRDVGTWRVVTAKETGKKGSPSFCQSGAGHPVWGRQWCIDKGFGLGSENDVRWARAIDFQNVVFRSQPATDLLARNVLLDVLGDVVFNRLATHAITLGLSEPLAGRWLGEPTGARVLLLSSGERPVAEIVDANRDGRADMMVVALRR